MTSSGKLSDKFTKIQGINTGNNPRNNRKIIALQKQNINRQKYTMKKRGLLIDNNNKKQKSNIRNRNNNKPKGNGKRKGKKGNDSTPKSASDLDMELDSYWYEAGKGPNPVTAALDKDMDSYFANKTADTVATTATTTE
mmetsp:Transcript_8886/g.13319  ORF Transcript_8886/g.13319 Transcript_8886/m.13319 type:complete len:139 (+) Transcript_8886:76-492(+)